MNGEKAEVLPIKMTKTTKDKLTAIAGAVGLSPSVYLRKLIYEICNAHTGPGGAA